MSDEVIKMRQQLDACGYEYTEFDIGRTHVFGLDYCEQCGDFLRTIEVLGSCVSAVSNYLTPEQAIAATLGSGTCHIIERNGDLYCDTCGEMVGTCDPASELFIDGNAVELWNYCPNCGRKVVDS